MTVEILSLSGKSATEARATADALLDIELVVGARAERRRPVSIVIRAVSPGGAAIRREFKTTLSEPVDDEQWRVLGEGAAYRIIGDIAPARITRPALRAAQSLYIPSPGERVKRRNIFPGRTVEPLELRLDRLFGSAAAAEDVASASASR